MSTKRKNQSIDNPEITLNSIEKEFNDLKKNFGNFDEAGSLEQFRTRIKKASTDGVVTAKK